MKLIKMSAPLAALALLAACGGGADDKAADKIDAMAENKSDQLEEAADQATNEQRSDALEQQAEKVEDMGERKAEAADDQDNAVIANQVATDLNATTTR